MLKLESVFNFLIEYWLIFAVVFSIYFAFRSWYFTIKKNPDITSFFDKFYHGWISVIFNFAGSFFGWICLNILALEYLYFINNDKQLSFDINDFFLFVISLLGISGFLPQATFGIVKILDNLAVYLFKWSKLNQYDSNNK